MKHPIQQRLVDFCNKICHVKSKSEEPESFLSKKDHSPKTSKEPSSPSLDNFVDLDYWSNETDPSLSSSFDFDSNSSDDHDPS